MDKPIRKSVRCYLIKDNKVVVTKYKQINKAKEKWNNIHSNYERENIKYDDWLELFQISIDIRSGTIKELFETLPDISESGDEEQKQYQKVREEFIKAISQTA